VGRLWTVQINLYAVLRKEPNWSGGNRAYWLKRDRRLHTPPLEAEGTPGKYALMVKPPRAFLFFEATIMNL